MTLSVVVNGAVRSQDASGRISVAPGDQIQITPSQPAQWAGNPVIGSNITVRNGNAAASAWSGQIVNTQPVAGNYSLTAVSSGTPPAIAAVTFAVSAGDTRNGKYQVFATNGTRQQLALNFDIKSYDMTDDLGVTVSGDLAADTEAGTWRFVNPRGTATATARFRVTTDTVVGGFPFAQTYAGPVRYSVQPFVASRAPVTSQAAIDGLYNRVGIGRTERDVTLLVDQVRISNGGTRVDMCQDAVVSAVATCSYPQSYRVEPENVPGGWALFNIATGASAGRFAIATIGGRNAYLVATKFSASESLFRIGVAEIAAGTNGTARGSDIAGAWGATTVAGNNFSSSGIAASGSALNPLTFTLSPANPAINGLRRGRTETHVYYVLQGAKIGAVAGITGYLAEQQYLQIGLLDD